jgi:hypothetical protein
MYGVGPRGPEMGCLSVAGTPPFVVMTDPSKVVKLPPQPDTLNKLHWFCPEIARRYGLNASVVYSYLEWRIRVKGRGSARPSLPEIQKVFPYLGQKQIRNALDRLSHIDEEEIFEHGRGTPPLIKRHQPTFGAKYVYELDFETAGRRKRHSFDPQMAVKYGIAAAVIYDDIAKWVYLNDGDGYGGDDQTPGDGVIQGWMHVDVEVPVHYESPTQWAKAHPYLPLRTIERAFKVLKDAGELIHYVTAFEKEKLYFLRDGKRFACWTLPFGEGKVKRWETLHKKQLSEGKLRRDFWPESDQNSSFAGPPKGQTTPPKGQGHRQNGRPDRQNDRLQRFLDQAEL